MKRLGAVAFLMIAAFTASLPPALAWNSPGHMLSAAIAYQVLRQESPQTIEKVKAVLEKHPWHANQWQARLQDVPAADRDLVLFMQASRWADDIRIQDKAQNRPPWHYINLPFKPEGHRTACRSVSPGEHPNRHGWEWECGEERERFRAKGNCTRV